MIVQVHMPLLFSDLPTINKRLTIDSSVWLDRIPCKWRGWGSICGHVSHPAIDILSKLYIIIYKLLTLMLTMTPVDHSLLENPPFHQI
jgi:hypothetical protein